MIKLFAIAFSIAAIVLSSSFAECSGGGCGKDDKKKDPNKEPAVRTFEF